MKVLIVYAHPEPESFTGSLKNHAVSTLTRAGHEVEVSDLYALGFKPQIDWNDFREPANREYLSILSEHGHGARTDSLSEDIRDEQDKLRWADVLILHFPMWWFSMPAIMKGWVDRVLTLGFAFDLGKMYEDGLMSGKRAMIVTSTAGPDISYTAAGRAGDIEAILWPINNGTLRFCGFDVLPPFVAYSVLTNSEEDKQRQIQEYEERLLALETTEPLFFHEGDDYDETGYRLRPDVEARTPAQRSEAPVAV